MCLVCGLVGGCFLKVRDLNDVCVLWMGSMWFVWCLGLVWCMCVFVYVVGDWMFM